MTPAASAMNKHAVAEEQNFARNHPKGVEPTAD
eukprot:CAMPEP_0204833440 /NCGR_PEP_ID=MMETSP1346-20131115/16838_1 /ASSEMBLY_ACC=CAM_ASM_000771 /TAXON_ID=215587 /ORGANISM="Aplanochytrium stocchinoi, Strain GSBS06" /LENGTH=32 /DNA_ID= /DNA_START= /DNA_END= /DNA_ORIENTATION=